MKEKRKYLNAVVILAIIGALLVVSSSILWVVSYRNYLKSQKELPTSTNQNKANNNSTGSNSTRTANTQSVKLFMIAIDDNGKSGKLIGCGDSAVSVEKTITPTKEVLKTALEELLKIKSKDYGQSGLYNPLYQSTLKVDSVSIVNKKATVKLSGTLTLSGTCEDPRIKAQLEETVLQFNTITSSEIYINGKLLNSYFDQSG